MDATLLESILNPKSIAIFGSSNDEKKWGYVVTKRLLEGGYRGQIFPINPKGGEILGIDVNKNINQVNSAIDLAVIGIRTDLVEKAVEDCIQKGVKGILIVTAGFGETGSKGHEVEKHLVQLANENNVRIVGPNCFGIVDTKNNVNASVLPAGEVKEGSIAALAQSGSLAVMLYEYAAECGLGLRSYIGVGNQADIQFHEWIDYFSQDQDTKLIVCYIEGLKQGRMFLESIRKAIRLKPIIVLKSGRSERGMKSAASHTGSIAGSDKIHEAAFEQAGGIRLHRSDEVFPVAEALLKAPLPQGNKIAIVTDGGGYAVLASDVAAEYNLGLAELSLDVVEKLRMILPPHANAHSNPVDTVGGMDYDQMMFAECSEVLLQDPEIAGLIFVGTLGGYDRLFWEGHRPQEIATAEAVCALVKKYNKPIIIQSVYSARSNHCMEVFYKNDVPVYSSLENAVQAMKCLTIYSENRKKQHSTSFINSNTIRKPIKELDGFSRASREKRFILMEHESRELLKAYSVDDIQYEVARTSNDAIAVSDKIGFPVAMKVLSPSIIHKSDFGTVHLNIRTKEEVCESFNSILNEMEKNNIKDFKGVIIEEYKTNGIEVIVGLSSDPQFGPVVMFGLGGVFVEAIKDVVFRVAPITENDAIEMIQGISGYALLAGYRSYAPRDISSLAQLLVKVGQIGMENQEIESLDLNPVLSFESGYAVLDARVVLKKTNSGGSSIS